MGTRLLQCVRSPALRGFASHERRGYWFAIGCAAVIAFEVWAFLPQVFPDGTPLAVESDNIRLVEELADGSTISQTFAPRAEALNGLTLWFRSPNATMVDVKVTLLASAGDAFAPLYSWTERVGIGERTAHTFAFAPVVPSRDRTLRFDVQLLGRSAERVAVEATVDNALRPGALTVAGREQWGDLRFRTRSATAYDYFLGRLVGVPRVLRHPAVPVGLAILYNWAIFTFLYFMLVADDNEWR